MDTAKAKPAFSKIKANYDSQGSLILKLPQERFTLREYINDDSEKKGFSLRNHFEKEYFKVCFIFVACAMFVGIIFLLFQYLKTIIIVLSLVVLFCTLIALAFLSYISFLNTEILINAQEVRIFRIYPKPVKVGQKDDFYNKKVRKTIPNKDWKILLDYHRLKLSVGNHELAFSGTREELLWLEQLLHNELALTEQDQIIEL